MKDNIQVPFTYCCATHKYKLEDCVKESYHFALLRELLYDMNNGIYTRDEAKRIANEDKITTQMYYLQRYQAALFIVLVIGLMYFIG